MLWIKRILVAALVLLCSAYVLLFSLRNQAIVDIDLVFIQLQAIQLEFALVSSFIVGGLLGLCSALPLYWLKVGKLRRSLTRSSQAKQGKG